MSKTSQYSILDNLLEGCQVIGHDWRYLYLNDVAAKHNHRPKEELLGRKYKDVWPGIEKTELFEITRRCLEERIPHSFENRFVFPDGAIGWFSHSVQPVPEGVIILSIDITDRKWANLKSEEQTKILVFQNEEKEKRAAELVVANKELTFQNEEKEKRAAELVVANEETLHRLQNIQALHKIDRAIAGSLDLNLTLDIILEQVRTELNVDAASVLLLDPHTRLLEFTSGVGFRGKAIERSHLKLPDQFSERGFLEGNSATVINLLENSTQLIRAPLLASEGFVEYFATPLIAKGQVNGILEVFHRLPLSPDENWLEFFRILAGQAAIALDNASLFTELKHSNAQLVAAYHSTIEGWSHALDLRDKETEGHTLRVSEMAVRLCRAAGISGEALVHVRRGALLHDIGKMGVPDHILLKPGELTDEEWHIMREHPTYAFELISPIAYLRPALDIPYCHHEKWDGSGYPRGLKGEQIPLAARLFAIIDVWDALLSDRPYRQGWPEEKVLEHIRALAGTHFNPEDVALFLRMLSEETREQ